MQQASTVPAERTSFQKAPTATRAQRYAAVVLRWLMIGLVTFGLTVGVGYYVINDVLPKTYTASTMVQLPAGEMTTKGEFSIEGKAPPPEIVNAIMSPELLLGVIKDLGLERQWAARLYKTNVEELPDVDALTRMVRVVKLQLQPGPNLVEITAASDVPEEAAQIADAVASRYVAQHNFQMHNSLQADLEQKQVRIVEHASIPQEPFRPNRALDYTITFVAAGVLGLLVASFVEMAFLFIRAGEREG